MSHTLRRARHGFTMIELIAVVAVIAVLVGVAQMNFGAVKEEAYQRALEADVRRFPVAQEQHRTRSGQYMSRVSDAPGDQDTSVGFFRLSEDVGILIDNVANDGFSAWFAHRKLNKVRCTLHYNRYQPYRVVCETSETFNSTGYQYQND
ncbi:MAG TPA: prepilin-type N-terminal cleavage/methylation domain-containing protein [Longimicrobium sp.]|jgi:prepilin-type N-terminal cleavage/methylation domain-containing protein